MNSVLYAGRMSAMPSSELSAQSSAHTVGVLGLGNMGLPMLTHLVSAASSGITIDRVIVTARSADRAQPAVDAGATFVATPRELAEACSIVILMVPDLPQVEEVLFAPNGLASAASDLVVVVCSSVSPVGIREVDARLRSISGGRMTIVDAPVSGGTEGAAAGTLSIMVGGTDEDVARVLPVLSACGRPVHLGALGAGQVAKACNQLIVAATMAAIAEASVVVEREGLVLNTVLSLLEGGYAGSRVLETKRERLVARDYSPTGVAKFMVKDLGFAAAAAESTGTRTPTLDAVRETFIGLTHAGLGDDDLCVIHRYIGELDREA
jgi:2-hydroxy-3-oxopropionate reductase